MKIKFTYPLKPYQCGMVYDVPDKDAERHIENGIAVKVDEESTETITTPLEYRNKSGKKVKNGDW